MTLSLEAELDLLFRVHPAEFVEARAALVARLTKTGERTAAAGVKALKRPTPAAWALNQIHFESPELLERAAAAGARVRELHARDGVTADALRGAMAEQRAASSALVDEALRRLESAGVSAGAAQQKKLAATVQGWLAGAGGELPGRMTHDLEFGGFEAIAAVGAPAREPAVKSAPEPAAEKPATRDAARLERARARVTEAEERALAAREVVRRRKEERDRLREQAAQAAQRVREAERTLEELREEARRSEAAVVRSERAIEEALASQKQADAAAASARAALPT